MIAERALALAGSGAHLVRRPGGRLHVYTGPLTRSGRFVPAAARALCRTRARRLEVVSLPRGTSLDPAAPRMCGRCSARLALRSPGRAEQPTSRTAYLATYASTTKGDVAFALQLATTPAEVDAAAHLSLLLFDVAGTLKPFTDRGRTWPPLHQLVHDARGRVHGFPESLYAARTRGAAIATAAQADAKARRKAAREEREARIERLGFTNATAGRRR